MHRIGRFLGWWVFPTIVFVILVVLGARAHPLWGDEAETALFARNILKYGVPKGWDGTNIMGIENAVVLDKNLVNHTSPWAQYYLSAASFAVFGQSSFAARIPSMALAILSLPLLYAIVLGLGLSKRIALFSLIIVSLSVPYLLFAYQARYYSLVTFAALGMIYAAIKTLKSLRLSLVFIVSGLALFYGNYVVFIAFYMSLFAMSILYVWQTQRNILGTYIARFIGLSVIIACFSAPWFFLLRPFESRGEIVLPQSIDFLKYLGIFTGLAVKPYHMNNAFPIGMAMLWFGFLVHAIVTKKHMASIMFPCVLAGMFLIIMAGFTVLGDVGTAFIHTRYTMLVLPLFAVCIAVVMDRIFVWKRVVGIVIFLIYLSTNLFTFSTLRFLVWDYMQETIFPYTTPDIVVASYLKKHAKRGDTVYINLDRDHEPLIFHLNDTVRFVNRVSLVNTRIFPENRGSIPRYIYDFRDNPDWIVLYSKRGNDGSFFTFDYRDISPAIQLSRDYEEIVLPVFFADMSRPEIELRSFYTIVPTYQDQVFIYKKK